MGVIIFITYLGGRKKSGEVVAGGGGGRKNVGELRKIEMYRTPPPTRFVPSYFPVKILKERE